MKSILREDFFEIIYAKSYQSRKPHGATFELTYGCNLRCVHCYNPTHRALPQELKTEEVFSILDQCAELGLATVCFSGGELFTRPDVFRILEHAKRLGLLIDMISNATHITPKIADRLEQLEIHSISVSIYGATQATYEQVTQVPGSYDKFVRGLQCLAAKKLLLLVRMPLMKENAHELKEAKKFVEGMGVRFHYCTDIDARNDGDLSPLAHRLEPAEKVRIDLEMMGYRDPDEMSCRVGEDFISCSCGKSRFAITPYGEMNLCVAFPMPKYDLRKGTIREGWEVLKHTVDEAKPNERYECPSCDVRSHCRQGRSDAWLETGDMSVCLPHHKEFARLEKAANRR